MGLAGWERQNSPGKVYRVCVFEFKNYGTAKERVRENTCTLHRTVTSYSVDATWLASGAKELLPAPVHGGDMFIYVVVSVDQFLYLPHDIRMMCGSPAGKGRLSGNTTIIPWL